MAVLKQKTVHKGNRKQRIGLKKLTNDLPSGGRHKYQLEDLDTGDLLEGPFTNKRNAEQAFRQLTSEQSSGLGSLGDPLDFDGDGIL